ncbi:MAG: HNH endonuclease signature motif containing protein [Nostoc sp.]
MSRPYINAELRRLVGDRAEHICEYCLVSEVDRSSGYQVDHIISVKHGGATTADNLCYACIFCNLQKGTDLGSIKPIRNSQLRFVTKI